MTFSAKIILAGQYPVMPDAGQKMSLALAVVFKTSVLTCNHVAHVIIVAAGSIGFKQLHDRLPFPAMRPDSRTMNLVGNKMRHLVRYGPADKRLTVGLQQ